MIFILEEKKSFDRTIHLVESLVFKINFVMSLFHVWITCLCRLCSVTNHTDIAGVTTMNACRTSSSIFHSLRQTNPKSMFVCLFVYLTSEIKLSTEMRQTLNLKLNPLLHTL